MPTTSHANHTALVNAPANRAPFEQFKNAALAQGYGAGFASAIESMIRSEGNYGSYVGDGAGYTFCGLTTKHDLIGYTKEQADRMTIGEVNARYYQKYWVEIGLRELERVAPALAYRCFDAHVNSGRGGLNHMLSWVCSRLGIEGGDSAKERMAAIASAIQSGAVDETAVHQEAHNARMYWYRVRCAGMWGRYGRGWTNRMKQVAQTVSKIRNSPSDGAEYYVGSPTEDMGSFEQNPIVAGGISLAFAIGGIFADGPRLFSSLFTPRSGKQSTEVDERTGAKFGAEDAVAFTRAFGPARLSPTPPLTLPSNTPQKDPELNTVMQRGTTNPNTTRGENISEVLEELGKAARKQQRERTKRGTGKTSLFSTSSPTNR